MRRRKFWLNSLFGVILLLCLASFGTLLMPNSSSEVIIAVISLDVALLALYISLRTFYSIDEVNAISRMDGNVMENPRYRPNILRAVFLFPQTDLTETSEALMSHLMNLFCDKNKQSGAHLADSVQETADLLVLVPYFIKTYDQKDSAIQLNSVSRLLTTIKNKVNNFKEISDGSCKVLEETVRLIESVVAYQSWDISNQSDPTKLLELRGSLFINPVTSVLYYDYLGLYFMRRARGVIVKQHEDASLRELIGYAKDCKGEDSSLVIVYLDKAISSFKRAKENVGDDMFWAGYIYFNVARAEYLKSILNESHGGTADNAWEEYMNESIRSWITTNKIIAEHLTPIANGNVSWLQRAFVSEENNVRLSKVIMQMMIEQPLTDYNGNAWVKSYNEIIDTPFSKGIPVPDPIKLTDSLKEDICTLLGEI